MGETDECRILERKSLGKHQIERPRRTCGYNIKTLLTELGCEDESLAEGSQVRVQ
jgi:hypothetical protein